MKGHIFRGAYLWREISVSKEIYRFCCFTLYLREISKYKPPGGLYSEGQFNGGFFLALQVWGAYVWRGLYKEGLIFGILRYFTRSVRS